VDDSTFTGPRRKGWRLPGFDYSTPGAYFVTLVLQDRVCRLARILAGKSCLTPAGQLIATEWSGLPGRFPGLALDEHVVMPDHVHGLLIVRPGADSERPNISDVIDAFKSKTTVDYGVQVRKSGWPQYRKRLWQRGFHDEIIRDARHFENVRRYIRENPKRWEGPP